MEPKIKFRGEGGDGTNSGDNVEEIFDLISMN